MSFPKRLTVPEKGTAVMHHCQHAPQLGDGCPSPVTRSWTGHLVSTTLSNHLLLILDRKKKKEEEAPSFSFRAFPRRGADYFCTHSCSQKLVPWLLTAARKLPNIVLIMDDYCPVVQLLLMVKLMVQLLNISSL